MKKKRKIAAVSMILFFVIFLSIIAIHIIYNVNDTAKELLPNWSRSIQMSSSAFNRKSIVEYSNNGYIVQVSPTEDGIGGLVISKFDKELNKIEDYEVKLDEININQIRTNDIILKGNELYWRNYKDNSLYLSIFDEDYKSIISTSKIYEGSSSFYVEGVNNKLYLAVSNLDGSVDLFIKETGEFEKLNSPTDIKNINTVKLLLDNETLYLQSVEQIDEYESNIYITEFKENKWSESTYLFNLNGIRFKVIGLELGVDNNYVYSIATIQRDGNVECVLYVNGYEKTTKAPFKTLKLEWAVKYGIDFFTDAPALISGNRDGIEILVVAPSSLTTRYNSSNVISMTLTPNELKDPILVSNTRNTSSSVDYLTIDDSKYVFWNEYDEQGKTSIIGASNKASIIEKTTVVTEGDVNYAIDREISAFSYLIILCFGARLLSIFPALGWLMCLIFFNEKLEKKYNLAFIIGIILYLVPQLLSMDFYYTYSSMSLMPEIINFTSANYIIPVVITILGSVFAYIYKKEGDSPEVYKVYSMYLLFNHILLNFLYAPYLV